MAAERETWGSWLQFLFSVIGSLVGFGNIWRFPYICYRNGGGAFLLPFCLFMVILGIPIGFLEILYCQYSNLGPGKVWSVCPLFKGIWCGMMVMLFVCSCYYTMLMAWVLHYVGMSFSPSLPWATCDNDWNTDRCVTLGSNSNTTVNDTIFTDTNSTDLVSSQEEYWTHRVLTKSSGIDELGGIQWELLLCLVVAWLLTFVALANGVRVMGKIAYVAATLPYILLTTLLIRGLMLPGATDGIYYFFYPQWDRLLDYTVWRDAATQLFFSAGYGFGVLATLASYNKFHNNCFRDAMLMPFLDTLTSIFAGTIIFAFVGYMAKISGKDVDVVIQQGPGLVFIAYPTALQTLPPPQLWSVLFFFMLFCTGLDSQFPHIQTLSTAIVDAEPKLLPYKTKIIALLCLVSFLITIPLTTQAGEYILNLMDWYIASICTMLLVFIELIVFAWIYGVERLYYNIEQMIGYRIHRIFGFSWKYSTPIIITILWTVGLADFRPIGSKYPGYFPWSDAIGLVLAFIPIIPIPVLAAWTLYNKKGTMKERLIKSIKPNKSWKPALSAAIDEEEETEKMTPLDHIVEKKNGHGDIVKSV